MLLSLPSAMAARPRIILALPDIIECTAVAEWLCDSGFEPIPRANPRAAGEEMRLRPFDLLVTDETFAVRDGLLGIKRQRNPLAPAIVIGNRADANLQSPLSRQAMYISRPVDCPTLLCTVSMAMMDERPIRRSARKIANHFEAVANGVSCHIIDVSHHGMRLQVPSQRLSMLLSHFGVRVPLIGISVIVQRIWTRSLPRGGPMPVTLCGAGLSGNRAAADEGWRAFVDMVPDLGTTSKSPASAD
jgi:DNA-binding response OmpR family regulator